MKKVPLLCIAFLLLSGCAYVISEQYREAAVKGVSFGQVLANPSAYENNTFIFGGTIVKTTNAKEGSEIEVIQNPIDRYGEITDRHITEGRFIILTSRHLDPLIFKQGKLVTFAGKLIGTRKQLFEGREYLYPLFASEELHLWEPVRYYSAPYPYWYDPLYYPYNPYSSYWYGPPFWRPYHYPYW